MACLRLFVVCCFALITSEVSAQFVFDLIQEDSSVLATLTLEQLSSDPEDVLALTFSEQAQDLFGYGPTYEGTFDSLSLAEDFARLAFEEDGIGLTGRAAITVFSVSVHDTQPPNTSLADIDASQFDIIAQDVIGSTDAIVLRYFDSGTEKSIRATGTWRLVPEPSATAHLIALAICMPLFRRRSVARCSN